jgi:hypothetical protein
MLSALGSNFGIDFTAKWATLGPQLGPYFLLVVGIIAAIIVVSFVIRYIRSKVAQ